MMSDVHKRILTIYLDYSYYFFAQIWNWIVLRMFHSKENHCRCKTFYLTKDERFLGWKMYKAKKQTLMACYVHIEALIKMLPCVLTQPLLTLKSCRSPNFPPFSFTSWAATHRRMHTSKPAYRRYLHNVHTVEQHGRCCGVFFLFLVVVNEAGSAV